VDAVERGDKVLEQDRYLPLVLHEVHELAGAGLLGHEQVAVDQFADLQEEIVELVVPVKLHLAEQPVG
jgi:hypothetical protein